MNRPASLFLAVVLSVAAQVFGDGAAGAHPHVFVDCSLTFVFDGQGLAGLRERWVLDEMFAAMVLGEHDANGDGVVQPSEVPSIKSGAFDNLKNYDYFTLVEINGKLFKPQWAKDFSASTEDGKLVYEFTIPCHVAAASQPKTIRVAVRDPEYYADVVYALAKPDMEGGEGLTVTLDQAEVPAWAYYGGQIVPEAAICTFRRSP